MPDLTAPREYELDLSQHTPGNASVARVFGYVSTEFDEPYFKLTRVILSNGMSMDVEGEHDLPFIRDERLTLPKDTDA